MSDSLQPHGLYSPWNSPGQNTGVGSLSLLQRIFPTQGLNPSLSHCRQILYQMSHKGNPRMLEWVAIPSPVDLPNPGIREALGRLRTTLNFKQSKMTASVSHPNTNIILRIRCRKHLGGCSSMAQLVKNPPAMQETLISRLERSSGEGKGYPLQCSGLENSMDCIVHGVTESRTQLND